MKFIASLFVLLSLISSCNEEGDATIQKKATERKKLPEEDSLKIIDYYVGVIPCADCEGIEQQLWLLKRKAGDNDGMFMLRESYLLPDTSLERIINYRGEWKMTDTIKDHISMKVLALKCDQSIPCGLRQYEVSYNKITMLDQKGNKIKSELNYSLHRNH